MYYTDNADGAYTTEKRDFMKISQFFRSNVHFHLTYFVMSGILCLQFTTVMGFDMSDEGIEKAIRQYLSIIYEPFDEEIDADLINRYIQVIKRHSDVFQYLADAQTATEVLPYLDEYNVLTLKYTNRPLDPDVKVIFTNHPLKRTPHDSSSYNAGICDPITRVILLDRNFWEYHNQNERLKKSVLFHELGHCDLYRNYSNEEDNSEGPIDHTHFSLMTDRGLFFSASLLLPDPFLKASHARAIRPLEEAYKNIFDANLDRVLEAMFEELFSEARTSFKDLIIGKVCSYNNSQEICSYQSLSPEEMFQTFRRAIDRHRNLIL